jgi:hypothetical protein
VGPVGTSPLDIPDGLVTPFDDTGADTGLVTPGEVGLLGSLDLAA